MGHFALRETYLTQKLHEEYFQTCFELHEAFDRCLAGKILICYLTLFSYIKCRQFKSRRLTKNLFLLQRSLHHCEGGLGVREKWSNCGSWMFLSYNFTTQEFCLVKCVIVVRLDYTNINLWMNEFKSYYHEIICSMWNNKCTSSDVFPWLVSRLWKAMWMVSLL